MKYVGLDLSLAGTGVCIHNENDLEVLDTIATLPKHYRSRFERIDAIAERIRGLLPPPEEVAICIEESFIHPERMSGQQDILNLAYAVRRVLHYADYSWRTVAATSLKKFVTGKGNMRKETMMMEVLDCWKIKTKDNNQADAFGLSKLAHVVHILAHTAKPPSIPVYRIEVARKVMAGK